MLILRVAEFVSQEDHNLLFAYQKEKYTYLNDERRVLTLNEIYLITINDRGEISYVTEIEPFSQLIITNMLTLSNEEILLLILKKDEIVKEYLYLQYSKEIEQAVDKEILIKSKIIGNLKIGSSYSRYYKAGEANDEWIFRSIVRHDSDTKYASIPKQSTPRFRGKGYHLFRCKVHHFVKDAGFVRS